MIIVMVANISKHLLCARNPWAYIFNPQSHSTYCARWELHAHCTGWEPEASRARSLAQITQSHRRAQKVGQLSPSFHHLHSRWRSMPQEEEEMHAGEATPKTAAQG